MLLQAGVLEVIFNNSSYLNHIMKKVVFTAVFLLFLLTVSAHEVYVLDKAEIEQAVDTQSPNPFGEIVHEQSRFMFWAFLSIVVVACVFFISISHRLENVLEPYLMHMKRYAPVVGRLTLGCSLLASGYYFSFFGPELSLGDFAMGRIVQVLLFVFGFCLVVGFMARFAALASIVLFGIAVFHYGSYMLTYFNYLAEMILIAGLGAGEYSVDEHVHIKAFKKVTQYFRQNGFVIVRVLFGISLMYASAYAKLLHSNLALETIAKYHLTLYFSFQPLFLVLGAMIIELLIGIFFLLGFEVRFVAIFFAMFLTLSIGFFGEAVWPHIILYGTAIAIFLHGYDCYTLEKRLCTVEEPIL